MKTPDQWRPIERRPHSPVLRYALWTMHGVVFKNPDRELEQAFIPAEEALHFYGSADAWVSHMMLTTVGGCSHMVEGR